MEGEGTLRECAGGGDGRLLGKVLFRVCFSSRKRFECEGGGKCSLVSDVIRCRGYSGLGNSFTFVGGVLLPFSGELLFCPSRAPLSISLGVLARVVGRGRV